MAFRLAHQISCTLQKSELYHNAATIVCRPLAKSLSVSGVPNSKTSKKESLSNLATANLKNSTSLNNVHEPVQRRSFSLPPLSKKLNNREFVQDKRNLNLSTEREKEPSKDEGYDAKLVYKLKEYSRENVQKYSLPQSVVHSKLQPRKLTPYCDGGVIMANTLSVEDAFPSPRRRVSVKKLKKEAKVKYVKALQKMKKSIDDVNLQYELQDSKPRTDRGMGKRYDVFAINKQAKLGVPKQLQPSCVQPYGQLGHVISEKENNRKMDIHYPEKYKELLENSAALEYAVQHGEIEEEPEGYSTSEPSTSQNYQPTRDYSTHSLAFQTRSYSKRMSAINALIEHHKKTIKRKESKQNKKENEAIARQTSHVEVQRVNSTAKAYDKQFMEKCQKLIEKHRILNPSYVPKKRLLLSGSPEEKAVLNEALSFASTYKAKFLTRTAGSTTPLTRKAPLCSSTAIALPTNDLPKEEPVPELKPAQPVFYQPPPPEEQYTPLKLKIGPKLNLLQTTAMPGTAELTDRIVLSKNEKLIVPWPSYSERCKPKPKMLIVYPEGRDDFRTPASSTLSPATTTAKRDFSTSLPFLQKRPSKLMRRSLSSKSPPRTKLFGKKEEPEKEGNEQETVEEQPSVSAEADPLTMWNAAKNVTRIDDLVLTKRVLKRLPCLLPPPSRQYSTDFFSGVKHFTKLRYPEDDRKLLKKLSVPVRHYSSKPTKTIKTRSYKPPNKAGVCVFDKKDKKKEKPKGHDFEDFICKAALKKPDSPPRKKHHGVLPPEGTVMVKLVRLPKVEIEEPKKVCIDIQELCASSVRSDDNLVIKPKKLPCLKPSECPCVDQPEMTDVKLCRLKKRYKPVDPPRICPPPPGKCDVPRADDNLKEKPKKLRCIVPGDCPCMQMDLKDCKPLKRIKWRPVEEPRRICISKKDECPPRADEGMEVKRKQLPCLKPSDCPCAQLPEMRDSPPLAPLPKVCIEEPEKICPRIVEECPERSDDLCKYEVKKKSLQTMILCEKNNEISARDYALAQQQKKIMMEHKKKHRQLIADKGYHTKAGNHHRHVSALTGHLYKRKFSTYGASRSKASSGEGPGEDYIPPWCVAEMKREALEGRKKTHDTLPPPRPEGTIMPVLARLQKRKGFDEEFRDIVWKQQPHCKPPCAFNAKRMDEIMNYQVRKKKLPCLPSIQCPCVNTMDMGEDTTQPLPRLKKRAVPCEQCKLPDCKDPCEQAIRADDGKDFAKKKKLPLLCAKECPCPEYTGKDITPKLKRLPPFDDKSYDIPWKKAARCMKPCKFQTRADDDKNLYRKKKLPCLSLAGKCPCVNVSQYEGPQPVLVRLPKKEVEEPPRVKIKCAAECDPSTRADAICKVASKKKPLPCLLPHLKILKRKYSTTSFSYSNVSATIPYLPKSGLILTNTQPTARSSLLNMNDQICYLCGNANCLVHNIRGVSMTSSYNQGVDDKKCKKLGKGPQKPKCPKLKPLADCPPRAKTISCDLKRPPPKECTKQNAPYKSFAECKDPDPEEFPSECGVDRTKYLQPKNPILNDIVVLKPPPPYQGRIDPSREEECVLKKLGLEREDNSRTCDNFHLPVKPIRAKELLAKHEEEMRAAAIAAGTTLEELEKKALDMAAKMNKSKPGSGKECPVVNTDTCHIDPMDLLKGDGVPEDCKSGKEYFRDKKRKNDPCDPCDPCESVCPVEDEKLECPKERPKSLWERILDYFKARPGCPSPDEWKKKRLREQAEKAAKAAGLELCEKKPCKKKRKKKKKSDCKTTQPAEEECAPKKAEKPPPPPPWQKSQCKKIKAGGPTDLKGKTGDGKKDEPKKECAPKKEEPKKNVEAKAKECKPPPKEECKSKPKEEPKPKEECKPKPKEECKPKPKAECKPEVEAKPKTECNPKPKTECKPKPKTECKPKPKDDCKPKPKDDCDPKPKDECKPKKPKDECDPEPKRQQSAKCVGSKAACDKVNYSSNNKAACRNMPQKKTYATPPDSCAKTKDPCAAKSKDPCEKEEEDPCDEEVTCEKLCGNKKDECKEEECEEEECANEEEQPRKEDCKPPGPTKKGSKKCPKFKMADCPPRARFSCDEMRKDKKKCKPIVAPYPSFSECMDTWPKLTNNECTEHLKIMRSREITYDYDEPKSSKSGKGGGQKCFSTYAPSFLNQSRKYSSYTKPPRKSAKGKYFTYPRISSTRPKVPEKLMKANAGRVRGYSSIKYPSTSKKRYSSKAESEDCVNIAKAILEDRSGALDCEQLPVKGNEPILGEKSKVRQETPRECKRVPSKEKGKKISQRYILCGAMRVDESKKSRAPVECTPQLVMLSNKCKPAAKPAPEKVCEPPEAIQATPPKDICETNEKTNLVSEKEECSPIVNAVSPKPEEECAEAENVVKEDKKKCPKFPFKCPPECKEEPPKKDECEEPADCKLQLASGSKCNDPCEKEDPCGKEDPCEKEDPCKDKADPCAKKDPCEDAPMMAAQVDPCEEKKDPCAEQKDPCAELKDPCAEKKDPCAQLKDPCEEKKDPCAQLGDPCEEKTDPCAEKKDPCMENKDPCAQLKDPCEEKKDSCVEKKEPCAKKEDPCAKKEDPCAKKEDPCAKKEDPCAKKEDPCAKQKAQQSLQKAKDPCEDPCAQPEDPCKKKDPCAAQKDPCAAQEDPCISKDAGCAPTALRKICEDMKRLKEMDEMKKKLQAEKDCQLLPKAAAMKTKMNSAKGKKPGKDCEDPFKPIQECKPTEDLTPETKKKVYQVKKKVPSKTATKSTSGGFFSWFKSSKKSDAKSSSASGKKKLSCPEPVSCTAPQKNECEKKDPCKKDEKKECAKKDPCEKKADPCEKKADPCKKEEKKDPCKKDPCKKEEKKDPCKKPAKVECAKKDPCKKEEKKDPCKKAARKQGLQKEPCKRPERKACGKKKDPCKKEEKKDPCKKPAKIECVKLDPCKMDEKKDPCKKEEKKDPCKEEKPKKVECAPKKAPPKEYCKRKEIDDEASCVEDCEKVDIAKEMCEDKKEAKENKCKKPKSIQEQLDAIEEKLNFALEQLNKRGRRSESKENCCLQPDQWKQIMLLKKAEKAARAAGYELCKKCKKNSSKRCFCTLTLGSPQRRYYSNSRNRRPKPKKFRNVNQNEESAELDTNELAIKILTAVKEGMKMLEKNGYMDKNNPYYNFYKELDLLTETDGEMVDDGGRRDQRGASKAIVIKNRVSPRKYLIADADRMVAKDGPSNFWDNDFSVLKYEESEKRKTDDMVKFLDQILERLSKN